MNRAKQAWFKLPSHIRKPVVLVVGVLFVVSSILTGWLPGPGGIPLFIIGVTILATEYEWATRFRNFTLNKIKQLGFWYKNNKFLGTLAGAATLLAAATLSYLFYSRVLY